jgi:hypothetical protein
LAKRREERKDDSLPRNLPIIILIKNIYEEKTDDFAATPEVLGAVGEIDDAWYS